MLKKTIAKFYVFVIFAAAVSAFFSACAYVASDPPNSTKGSHYGTPKINGKITSAEITESSGIAASRCQSNVLWTHNDSGDDAFIFALNPTGGSLGTWKIPNAKNIDWEDIATYKDKTGKCFVYIGEIGDNNAKRNVHTIYRIVEPLVTPANANSSRKEPIISAEAEVVNFTYPDYDQDAETLMVNPKTAIFTSLQNG